LLRQDQNNNNCIICVTKMGLKLIIRFYLSVSIKICAGISLRAPVANILMLFFTVRCVCIVSRCPCIRHARYCVVTAKHIVKRLSLSGGHNFLFFDTKPYGSSVVNKFRPSSMLITASVDFVYISRRVSQRECNRICLYALVNLKQK